MALSTVGKVEGAEVVSINDGLIIVELDSAERGRLVIRGKTNVDTLKEGSELRVLVIETRDGKFGKPFHTVTDKLDYVIDIDEDDAPAAASAKPDSALVLKFPKGKSVKGPVAYLNGDAAIVMLGDVRARLLYSELGTTKKDSLRKGVCVSANVLRVDGTGVVLSKKVSA